MRANSPPWRRAALRLALGLAPLAASAGAAAEPPPQVAPAAAPVVVPDLATARRITLERQPSVLAARASLAAAVSRRDSLERLKIGTLLARDLPIRRQQAEFGVQAAEAALRQAEAEALYDVTYSWLAVLYAREQQLVVDDALEQAAKLRRTVNGYFEPPRWWREEKRTPLVVKKAQVPALDALTDVANARREEAVQGEQRALAILREALGLGPGCLVVVPPRPLPEVTAAYNRDQLLCAALGRRGELEQVAAALEVTRLEAEAQRITLLPASRTFASASDIHAQPLPGPGHGFEYRPGAVGLEMPPFINGPRKGRVEQAWAYHDRAEAVAEKTRNLIALEADDAFLLLQEKRTAWERLSQAEAKARVYLFGGPDPEDPARNIEGLQSLFAQAPPNSPYPTVENLIAAGAAYTNARAQARTAHFQYLVLLARLERITGGALCVDFDGGPR